jgi:hypothetical protein
MHKGGPYRQRKKNDNICDSLPNACSSIQMMHALGLDYSKLYPTDENMSIGFLIEKCKLSGIGLYL